MNRFHETIEKKNRVNRLISKVQTNQMKQELPMLPDSTQYHKTIPKFKKNLQIGEHNCGFVGWPKQALSLYIISQFLLFASWHNGF